MSAASTSRIRSPRFPDGLTLIKGDGQFRGDGNTIVKEQSFVLILLYPHDTRDEGLRGRRSSMTSAGDVTADRRR